MTAMAAHEEIDLKKRINRVFHERGLHVPHADSIQIFRPKNESLVRHKNIHERFNLRVLICFSGTSPDSIESARKDKTLWIAFLKMSKSGDMSQNKLHSKNVSLYQFCDDMPRIMTFLEEGIVPEDYPAVDSVKISDLAMHIE